MTTYELREKRNPLVLFDIFDSEDHAKGCRVLMDRGYYDGYFNGYFDDEYYGDKYPRSCQFEIITLVDGDLRSRLELAAIAAGFEKYIEWEDDMEKMIHVYIEQAPWLNGSAWDPENDTDTAISLASACNILVEFHNHGFTAKKGQHVYMCGGPTAFDFRRAIVEIAASIGIGKLMRGAK